MKPFIFIFDIDGTLIGDISPQVMVYDIIHEIKKFDKNFINFDNNDLIHKLQNGIVRPHFLNFLKIIKHQYENIELFIYTASKREWALFLIKNIEKAYNIKFNRPIFTRDNCLYENSEYKKNLSTIKGKIYKSLKHKYPNLQLEDLQNKVLMIDNNNVFHKNDQDSLIICPSYNFKYPENVPSKIKCLLYEKHCNPICTIINRYISSIPLTSNFLKFQKYFYQNYIEDISRMKKNEDEFWLSLGNILVKKNIKLFDSKSIKYLNSKIGKYTENELYTK